MVPGSLQALTESLSNAKNEFKNALERIDHHIPSLRKILSCLVEGIIMSGPPRSPSWAPSSPAHTLACLLLALGLP